MSAFQNQRTFCSYMESLRPLSTVQLLEIFDSTLDSADNDVIAMLTSLDFEPGYELGWLIEVAIQFASTNKWDFKPLLDRLDDADEMHASAIFASLEWSDPKRLDPASILIPFLTDPRELVAASAIRCAGRLGCTAAREIVIAQLHVFASSPVARASLNYLSKIDPSKAIPRILIELETSTDIHMLQCAIDNAAEMNLTKAMPMLKKLRGHPHEFVRQAADYAVKTMRTTQPQKAV